MGLNVDIEKRFPGFSLKIKLDCAPGVTGILGASGSGKSMLLNCIAGLVKPDAGTIVLDGRMFFDASKRIHITPQHRKAGILFQNYALFPHMTIRDNIAFALDGLTPGEKDEKVGALLKRFNIADFAGRYPAQISGGQQQRVALARALAVEPDILLLDEPFSALDQHLKTRMMKDMAELLKDFKGCALFVTHNMEEAYRLCARLVIINSGRVEASGPRQEIFERPESYETAVITGCKNIRPAVRVSDHSVRVPDWGLTLTSAMEIGAEKGFAGIRSNHLRLAGEGDADNCFAAWIADVSEAPFTTTLYLKPGSKPDGAEDYQLQCELKRDQLREIADFSQPVTLHFDPAHVFFTEH
ncbi:molybdate transport system ATP-binding protein [Sporobacter termitidis DSM 10068]|uniref:Molybdate transport system ATP-binding protein n=1 Tax=Sporobacter termitidis DSM 10068 TaxID=1123282 RepID=A0A1M5UUC2_9FIRM|nr:sulfate/molybdate ABC transporter ATP-binding protein [Sporobacter termitidis]SHH66561.1 molybdate transport system ATP-binding protein [Sporobacter termitidis DSM 10068]